jgi:23S rRNA pseudouridine2605 synthase
LSEKLQKVLARAGLGSRRELERWIADGRVSIDGQRADLGARVSPGQDVRVDGRRVRLPEPDAGAAARVLLYHKPEGEVCTRRDPAGRPTVFEHLPGAGQGRWVGIGRLDLNTSGLLLLTTDGDLANRLMHPSTGVEREYAVRVRGAPPESVIRQLLAGVELDDGPAGFDMVQPAGGGGANRWYHVVIREGRKREVRRLWEAVGCPVSRLIRVRYGPIRLPRGLRSGRWRELDPEQVNALRALAGLPEQAPRPRRSGRGQAGRRQARGKRPRRGTARHGPRSR